MLQLVGTAVLCRVLPKVKPPCTYSLLSIRAQIAALKMSMVLQASEMLADASIVPAFIRMCGATFGHGCAMGLQVRDLEEELWSHIISCPPAVVNQETVDVVNDSQSTRFFVFLEFFFQKVLKPQR